MAKVKPTSEAHTPTEPKPTNRRRPRIVGAAEDFGTVRPDPKNFRPFVLLWSRGDYALVKDGVGGHFVGPRLVVQKLENGCCGVVEAKDGRLFTSGLEEDARQSGKIVVPVSLDYCLTDLEFEDCFIPSWGKIVGTALVESPEQYANWVRGLMDSGVIPAPTEEQIRALLRKHINLEEQTQAHHPQSHHRLSEQQKLTKAVELELAKEVSDA